MQNMNFTNSLIECVFRPMVFGFHPSFFIVSVESFEKDTHMSPQHHHERFYREELSSPRHV